MFRSPVVMDSAKVHLFYIGRLERVVLTDEGLRESERLFIKLFAKK